MIDYQFPFELCVVETLTLRTPQSASQNDAEVSRSLGMLLENSGIMRLVSCVPIKHKGRLVWRNVFMGVQARGKE